MTVCVNGERREVIARDVAELMNELGLPAAACLVEHNGTALRRDEWRQTSLREGDRLEMIQIVAGG
jgi:sulfur carrier protein